MLLSSIHNFLKYLWESSRKFRASLVKEGVLAEVLGGYLVFSQDYVFTSPSKAAEIVLGRSANGRTEWKNAAGKTLKELQDAS